MSIGVAAAEGRPARQQLVEDCAQRIHVGGGQDVLGDPAGLLRRHVAGGAENRTGQRQGRGVAPRVGHGVRALGEPEIADLRRTVFRQENVRGFEVPVDDAALVGRVHAMRELLDQRGRGKRLPGNAGYFLCKAAALKEFQGEVRKPVLFADVVNLHNVGVPDPGDRFRLQAEARQLLRPGMLAGKDHLQRDEPIQLEMACLVDNAHAAATQLGHDVVALNDRSFARAGGGHSADGRRHRFGRLRLQVFMKGGGLLPGTWTEHFPGGERQSRRLIAGLGIGHDLLAPRARHTQARQSGGVRHAGSLRRARESKPHVSSGH